MQSRLGHAEIAQLVERNLAKVEVAGPSPVFRSKKKVSNFADLFSFILLCVFQDSLTLHCVYLYARVFADLAFKDLSG